MIRDTCFASRPQWETPKPHEVEEYLEIKGITAYRAAKIIGVHKSTVSRWLSGEIVPQYAHWRLLVSELEG